MNLRHVWTACLAALAIAGSLSGCQSTLMAPMLMRETSAVVSAGQPSRHVTLPIVYTIQRKSRRSDADAAEAPRLSGSGRVDDVKWVWIEATATVDVWQAEPRETDQAGSPVVVSSFCLEGLHARGKPGETFDFHLPQKTLRPASVYERGVPCVVVEFQGRYYFLGLATDYDRETGALRLTPQVEVSDGCGWLAADIAVDRFGEQWPTFVVPTGYDSVCIRMIHVVVKDGEGKTSPVPKEFTWPDEVESGEQSDLLPF